MYWVELRATVRRTGPPKLVPLVDIAKYVGFRSVFAFDDDTARQIRETGTTADMRGTPVYADTLFVDFDKSDGIEFIAHLQQQGIAHQVWHSGGRSIHVHVPLIPVFGDWVPAACKEYLKAHAPGADLSFIHPVGVYRLPGTYHPKRPGKRKELRAEQAGAALQLVQPANSSPRITFDEGGRVEDFFIRLLERKSTGERHKWIWFLATKGAEAGLAFDVTLDAIRWWNARMTDSPHDDYVLQSQCTKAYERLARMDK
jgi:hypothetical protein